MKTDGLKQIIKQYFSFSRSERYGIIFLCSFLFFAIILNYSINYWSKPTKTDFSEIRKAIAMWESLKEKTDKQNKGTLFQFNPNTITKQGLDSLRIPENIKANILKYRQKGGKFYNSESVHKIYGMNDSIFILLESYLLFDRPKVTEAILPEAKTIDNHVELSFFDPNQVSDEELKVLGFSNFQIQNILKYRQKGGLFKEGTDLLRIYGVDSGFFVRIKPWITIKEMEARIDTLIKAEEQKIELNEADSASLLKLKGIGPGFASRIIRYRELLGGFYTINQLLEVYNFKNETFDLVKNKIMVDSVKIEKLSLNFSDYNELAKHPYLSGDDVKNILKFRNRKGSFETCEDLVIKKILPKEKFEKLKPYLKVN